MYFSGFSLSNEKELFNEYLYENDFTIIGFSYGAIKAFNYALNTNKRIDKLQFISPAFFQNKEDKYKRLQIMFFKKNSDLYCKNFIKKLSKQKEVDLSRYYKKGKEHELKELLEYNWTQTNLEILTKSGIKIEVFLGENDEIIDVQNAYNFFKNYSTVYYFKNKGHML